MKITFIDDGLKKSYTDLQWFLSGWFRVVLWNILLRPQLSYVTLTTVERISLPTASDFCELVTGLDFTFSTTALDSSSHHGHHNHHLNPIRTSRISLLVSVGIALRRAYRPIEDPRGIENENWKIESEQKVTPWNHYCCNYLNVGRLWLLKLKVPVLVSRNAVPQSAAQGQAEIFTILMMMMMMTMILVNMLRRMKEARLAPSEGGSVGRKGRIWYEKFWDKDTEEEKEEEKNCHLLKVEAFGVKEGHDMKIFETKIPIYVLLTSRMFLCFTFFGEEWRSWLFPLSHNFSFLSIPNRFCP